MSSQNPHKASSDTFDRGIVPAETAARKEREGDSYKQTPEQAPDSDINTAGGYTTNSEGVINNFPIEPEMYVETPGDLRDQQAAAKEAEKEKRLEANDTSEQGKLTKDSDERGKGVGII